MLLTNSMIVGWRAAIGAGSDLIISVFCFLRGPGAAAAPAGFSLGSRGLRGFFSLGLVTSSSGLPSRPTSLFLRCRLGFSGLAPFAEDELAVDVLETPFEEIL